MTSHSDEVDLFLLVLQALRVGLPCSMPVNVRRVPLAGDMGDTSRRSRSFAIRVNSEIDLAAQLLVLCHEWGHARAWSLEDEDDLHCGHWGIEAAKAYRIGKKIWSEVEGW